MRKEAIKQCDKDFARLFGGKPSNARDLRVLMSYKEVESVDESVKAKIDTNYFDSVNYRFSKKGTELVQVSKNGLTKEYPVQHIDRTNWYSN